MVPQSGFDQHHKRHGHISLEEAAAGLYCPACLGLFAGLSVPCSGPGDATAPDRHRAVQIRLLQAERSHQAGAE